MRRNAFAIAAIALLAGVVTGGERPTAPAAAMPRTGEAPATAPEDLDVARLARTRGEPTTSDLFGSTSFAPPPSPPPPPVATKPEPPPVPSAPALPFSYLGRMKRGERSIVYLLRQQDMMMAEAGEMIARDYRLDSISETELRFTYLPLGTSQTLTVPAAQ